MRDAAGQTLEGRERVGQEGVHHHPRILPVRHELHQSIPGYVYRGLTIVSIWRDEWDPRTVPYSAQFHRLEIPVLEHDGSFWRRW
jgi:hypothetical protein